jgi:hypothetical protein
LDVWIVEADDGDMNMHLPHTSTATSKPRQLLSAVRDDLRERRQARAEHRALERELSAYTTRSDVDDLLAAMNGHEGEDVERIRSILADNLQHHEGHGLIAS